MDTNQALTDALRTESMDDRWTFEPQMGGNVTAVSLDVSDAINDLQGGALTVYAAWDGECVGASLDYAASQRFPEWVRESGTVEDRWAQMDEHATNARLAALAVLAYVDRVVPMLSAECYVDPSTGRLQDVEG